MGLRLSAAGIFLLGAAGLLLHSTLLETGHIRPGMFCFYTNLSNLLVLVYELALAAAPEGVTIDYSERCLFFNGKRVGLAKKEFDIVELLSQNPGQVFDKERIYEHIWGYDSEGDSSVVAEHIRRIRSKIAAYTDRMYIETVWGCGYKWVK